MSTTDILQRGGADAQSTDDRARAAVKVFHRMQPTLTAYARALTGKSDVYVVMSADSNGHTDGKKIYFRPPLALGDNLPHDRKLCDTRDRVTRKQNCEACAVREAVLITIYHEIAHIAQDSFAVASDEDRAKMIKYALELVDKKFIEAILARVESAPIGRKGTAIGMAGLVSPYLPGIVNALEDARVNRDAAIARPGTRIMFEVDTTTILGEGFEQKMPDGSVQMLYWRDRPLNVQMVCGLYVKAAGYNYREAFVPEVVAALDDVQINKLLRDFPTVRNAKGVYMIAVPVLARLRELGFMQHWTDPQVEEENDEPEPEPEESQDDSGTDEEVSDSGEQPPTPQSGAGGDDGPDDEEDSDSDSDEGSGGEGSSGAPEEQQEDVGDRPSETGDGDEDSTGSGDSTPDDQPSNGEGDAGLPPERSDSADADDQQDDQGSVEDEGSPADSQDASSDPQAGEVDEQSTDSSDDAVQGDDSGKASEEDGSGSEGDGHEMESGGEDASRTGSDHNSSEAGPDAQSLDSGETLGESEPEDTGAASEESDSRDSVDSESDDGDNSDSTRKEADEAPVEDSDERADVPDDGPSPDDGQDLGDGEEPEVIDSGADEGLGGVELIEDSAFDRLPMGTPEEVSEAIHEVAHPEERPDYVQEEASADKEMGRAVVQGLYFETPSRNVYGVREHYWNQPVYIDGHNTSQAWDQTGYSAWGYSRKQLGLDGEFDCPESILGPALLRMRIAFADNKRGKDVHNRKSGRVDGRVLGRRAFNDDPRLFKYRILPGKKDYFVLIGIDVSGSTIGRNIVLAKRAAMAQAELCSRMGIKFAVYAHSGNYHNPDGGRIDGLDVDVYHIKEPDEPWTDETRLRLTALGPDCVNLDGHTFEYYRKILDRRPETHKVMLYYTDGKMPAENHDEELIILQREIKLGKKRKYVLLGVGIRTDSPVQHGLDTVQVDNDQDLVKVVQHLEKRLLEI